MIRLEAMSEQDFNEFAEYSIRSFAQGSPRYRDKPIDVALSEVRKEFLTKIMPDGYQSKGHLLFTVFNTEAKIGYLHLGEVPTPGSKNLHAWDFLIFEPFRGQGFGKQTMIEAGKKLKELGYQRVTLNVFGNNVTASTLYQRLGFEISQIQMVREL